MNEITLGGCSPTPLASYLKALGVLRLLSACHPETKAAWRNESFLLQTPLTREELEQFFLRDYSPTPVMAPWNGGSGFYEKDNKDALETILQSSDARLDLYRNCLNMAEEELVSVDRSASPKGDEKALLLTRMRGILPDEAVAWLDAAVLLADGTPQYPPLLGTGGNDGRLDFTNNFMQRLIEVLCLSGKSTETESRDWLRLALFGDTAPGLTKRAIGQFSPGQAGGPNATTGFDADAAINPWDFVLMIEGSLPFAAAAVRRNADDPYGVLSYPFTVKTVGAGSGSLGEGDTANARGELWMPLWNQLASYVEIRALLSEGRVALGRKPARDALDFVRAIHHLGGYRGIRSFERYGLLMRSGKAYLATPLERVEVTDNPSVNLLDELDRNNWLERFRRFAQGETTANSIHILRRRLENAFFDFSGKEPSPERTQAVLTLLGEIESALANSRKAREEKVDPLPKLSEKWVQHANDHTPAFHIARALAGLRSNDKSSLPLCAQFFPVHPRFTNKWVEDANNAGNDPVSHVRLCTGTSGSLLHVLQDLLEHRLWLAQKLEMKDKPLDSPAGATLSDVAAFLRDPGMDRRIAMLLPGLSLCSIPKEEDYSSGDGSLPAAFALLKLCFTPDSILRGLGLLGQDERLPVPPGILAQLASGHDPERAVLTAWRRLHASGLNPVFSRNALPSLAGILPQRVAAALLIPLRYGAYGRLVRSVLKKANEEVTSPAA